MSANKRLLLAVCALIGVVVLGTLGYELIEGASLGDAAFMTLITVSTVGFGEAWPLSAAGRVWTALLIAGGILVVAVAFTSLQAMIIRGELRTVLGRRKLEDRIAKLEGHYIVCGYGRMGRLISAGLHERGKKVVVIDKSPDRTVEVGEAGMDYVLGDATDELTLKAAGVDKAAGVVTVLHGDAQNVYTTLTATDVRPDITVIARAEQTASEHKLKRAGAACVISPQTIGASRVVNLLVRPSVAHVVDVVAGGGEWEVEEFPIPRGSAFVGRSLRDINLRQRSNALVFAISGVEGTTSFNPDPATVLAAGDVLIVIGPAGIAEVLSELDTGTS